MSKSNELTALQKYAIHGLIKGQISLDDNLPSQEGKQEKQEEEFKLTPQQEKILSSVKKDDQKKKMIEIYERQFHMSKKFKASSDIDQEARIKKLKSIIMQIIFAFNPSIYFQYLMENPDSIIEIDDGILNIVNYFEKPESIKLSLQEGQNYIQVKKQIIESLKLELIDLAGEFQYIIWRQEANEFLLKRAEENLLSPVFYDTSKLNSKSESSEISFSIVESCSLTNTYIVLIKAREKSIITTQSFLKNMPLWVRFIKKREAEILKNPGFMQEFMFISIYIPRIKHEVSITLSQEIVSLLLMKCKQVNKLYDLNINVEELIQNFDRTKFFIDNIDLLESCLSLRIPVKFFTPERKAQLETIYKNHLEILIDSTNITEFNEEQLEMLEKHSAFLSDVKLFSICKPETILSLDIKAVAFLNNIKNFDKLLELRNILYKYPIKIKIGKTTRNLVVDDIILSPSILHGQYSGSGFKLLFDYMPEVESLFKNNHDKELGIEYLNFFNHLIDTIFLHSKKILLLDEVFKDPAKYSFILRNAYPVVNLMSYKIPLVLIKEEHKELFSSILKAHDTFEFIAKNSKLQWLDLEQVKILADLAKYSPDNLQNLHKIGIKISYEDIFEDAERAKFIILFSDTIAEICKYHNNFDVSQILKLYNQRQIKTMRAYGTNYTLNLCKNRFNGNVNRMRSIVRHMSKNSAKELEYISQNQLNFISGNPYFISPLLDISCYKIDYVKELNFFKEHYKQILELNSNYNLTIFPGQLKFLSDNFQTIESICSKRKYLFEIMMRDIRIARFLVNNPDALIPLEELSNEMKVIKEFEDSKNPICFLLPRSKKDVEIILDNKAKIIDLLVLGDPRFRILIKMHGLHAIDLLDKNNANIFVHQSLCELSNLFTLLDYTNIPLSALLESLQNQPFLFTLMVKEPEKYMYALKNLPIEYLSKPGFIGIIQELSINYMVFERTDFRSIFIDGSFSLKELLDIEDLKHQKFLINQFGSITELLLGKMLNFDFIKNPKNSELVNTIFWNKFRFNEMKPDLSKIIKQNKTDELIKWLKSDFDDLSFTEMLNYERFMSDFCKGSTYKPYDLINSF